MVNIRAATEQDKSIIRQMVIAERLDPSSLNWQHFLIAEVEGEVAGIGQIKEYPGCQELGSLIVKEAYRKQGIGEALINALETKAGRPLYLLCDDYMEAYYQRFHYHSITWLAAPWFLKLKLAIFFPLRLFNIRVLVMQKGDAL